MLTSNVFIVPNGTLIAEIIAFVVVLWVVAKYVLPRLNQALAERQQTIAAELAAADEAKADAAAAEEARRAELEAARLRAREIVEQAQRTADRVAEEARTRGQTEYDRLVSSAESEVALARQRAVEEAAQKVGDLVVEVVERIIGREMDAATHRDLIDEAVAALGQGGGEAELASTAGHAAGGPRDPEEPGSGSPGGPPAQ
ncbi:MAG: F0F1 ATP synthase subunit B [Acidimicrobiales bacterium]